MGIEDKLKIENKGLECSVDSSYQPQTVPEKITDIYFKPKSFERSSNVYEWLGVKYFKKALMGTIGRIFRSGKKHADFNSNYFIWPDRSNKSLIRFERKTRFNELWHVPWIPFCTYCAVDSFAQGKKGEGIFYVVTMLINTYAAMLQRYNRARIYNTIEGIEGPKVWTGKVPNDN